VNKQLDDAITRVKTLPDEQQREAAQILLEFLDLQDSDMQAHAGADCGDRAPIER
jgi:hypothetical protein